MMSPVFYWIKVIKMYNFSHLTLRAFSVGVEVKVELEMYSVPIQTKTGTI